MQLACCSPAVISRQPKLSQTIYESQQKKVAIVMQINLFYWKKMIFEHKLKTQLMNIHACKKLPGNFGNINYYIQ
jgi:hypothetical protein